MNDERYYEQVADELRVYGPRAGLWAKSFAEANGDDSKAKAIYLRYRSKQIAAEEQIREKQESLIEEERLRKEWQNEEEARKLRAKLEGITPIHIILVGLPLLFLILLVFRSMSDH